MPIFDYKCHSCGSKEERMVKKHDDEVLCSECSHIMDKQISAPSFVLNGTGWYQTDFRGDKPRHLRDKENSEGWTRGMSDRFTDE